LLANRAAAAYRNYFTVNAATKTQAMSNDPNSRLSEPIQPSRREFFVAGVGVTAAAMTAIAAMDAAAEETRSSSSIGKSLIEPGKTILFQGDSITDVNRKRDDHDANSQAALGNGYAWLAAAQLSVDRPDDGLKIFNRGVSGDKVYQLADRWDVDCLELKPDVLSILIGVNDYWAISKHGYTGTLEKYETDYRALLKRTRNALPEVRLVVCEPFALECGAVDKSWFPAFNGYQDAAKRVADEAGAVFVPFQTMFDAAVKIAPPARWAADGVHPTSDGAALMAHWWLKAAGA
jgi:lysophospholipase L1-like esterase